LACCVTIRGGPRISPYGYLLRPRSGCRSGNTQRHRMNRLQHFVVDEPDSRAVGSLRQTRDHVCPSQRGQGERACRKSWRPRSPPRPAARLRLTVADAITESPRSTSSGSNRRSFSSVGAQRRASGHQLVGQRTSASAWCSRSVVTPNFGLVAAQPWLVLPIGAHAGCAQGVVSSFGNTIECADRVAVAVGRKFSPPRLYDQIEVAILGRDQEAPSCPLASLAKVDGQAASS